MEQTWRYWRLPNQVRVENKKKAKAEGNYLLIHNKQQGKKCHAKAMRSKKKPIQLIHKEPLMCRLGRTTRRKTRGGPKSGAERLERMKRGSGIKDRDDKSSGIGILMTETFAKINPTDPLILVKQVT